jgi:hypothetical protein
MVMNMTAIIYVASEIFMAPLLSCFTFWFSGDDKTDYETWWERIRNLAIVTIIPPPPQRQLLGRAEGKVTDILLNAKLSWLRVVTVERKC